MKKHEWFEWDDDKARRNAQLHAVSFDQAARMLSDAFYERCHVEEFDDTHSKDEDRYVTTGSDPFVRDAVIVVVWTDRAGATRIITARPATPTERKSYEDQIKTRQNHP